MTVTVAGAEIEKSRVDVVTLPQTAWAWIATPRTVAAALGDPAEIATVDGAPVLTGEVVKVERSRRHQRIIARPVALVDMIRRMVDPVTLQDQTVPALLAAVMGAHPAAVLPPLDSVPAPILVDPDPQPEVVLAGRPAGATAQFRGRGLALRRSRRPGDGVLAWR